MITSTEVSGMLRTLVLALLLVAPLQNYAGGGHPHGEDSHASHGAAAGREEESIVYTGYSGNTELFVEFPPLVANEPSTFVAHFTRMDTFKPLTSGTVDVYLKHNGVTAARFRVREPARTGIFLPQVTPKKTGDYRLSVEVRDADLHAIHDLGMVTVFASKDAVKVSQDEPEGNISYLKEQQWENPFAIIRAEARSMRPSVSGFATVASPVDGFAVIRAPSDGYFNSQTVAQAGDMVTAGQTLGSLVPRLGEGVDMGSLIVDREKARGRYELAKTDVERLQALYERGAIPERRYQEARQALEIARVELSTTSSRIEHRSGQGAQAGISLVSPLAGELMDVAVTPGAFVRAGDSLFTVASANRRWLDIRIPEKFGQNIDQVTGAWIEFDGKPLLLDANTEARIVKTSKLVDPATRTVNVAIEYPAATGPRLLGSRFPAYVFIGAPTQLLSVPASAIIDDGGQPVIYVQTAGETFSRRTVSLGIQDGGWVQVEAGIEAGEWVVSEGAYFVKLASAGGDAIGHGHAH